MAQRSGLQTVDDQQALVDVADAYLCTLQDPGQKLSRRLDGLLLWVFCSGPTDSRNITIYMYN